MDNKGIEERTKVLILSCNTGGGHNSVAAAIKEVYERHGDAADVVDAMSFLPYGWSEITSDVHAFVYRNTPDVARETYKIAETHRDQFNIGHPARSLLDLGVTKLGHHIMENGYAQVIACHIFAGLMLTDAISKFNLKIRSAIVETDYTVTPGAEKCNLDWHFVPSSKNSMELSGFGVDEKNIAVTGIPIRSQFSVSYGKEEARAKLGIAPGMKTIVIACGSMGGGNMGEIIDNLELLRAQCDPFQICAICGSNKVLYELMTEKYSGNKNVHIFGMVSDMSLMLDAGDVYITKPGGISVTEAAWKGIPMVLTDTVGGCEQPNMEFFVGSGGAVTGKTAHELAAKAVEICFNSETCSRMSAALKVVAREFDKEKVFSLMNL